MENVDLHTPDGVKKRVITYITRVHIEKIFHVRRKGAEKVNRQRVDAEQKSDMLIIISECKEFNLQQRIVSGECQPYTSSIARLIYYLVIIIQQCQRRRDGIYINGR